MQSVIVNVDYSMIWKHLVMIKLSMKPVDKDIFEIKTEFQFICY